MKRKKLFVHEIKNDVALDFIREHHRHLPKLTGAIACFGVFEYDVRLVGVATIGYSASSKHTKDGWLEVTRVATTGMPNVCSTLYGACSRWGHGKDIAGLLTYTRLSEPGTSLVASNWIYAGLTQDRRGRVSSRKLMLEDIELADSKRRWIAPWSDLNYFKK